MTENSVPEIMNNKIIHGLDHEIDCTCEDCFREFLPLVHESAYSTNKIELRARKITELAEQLGGFTRYVESFIETLPQYECDCTCQDEDFVNGENPVLRFGKWEEIPEINETRIRNVCCRCGGNLE